ncbi:MAG TPA: DUF3606 domain-containing protein [Burkholderiaceae bacterium]|nr:DUF3606 domain-containing protein [Burkholderiaceae bacterium]
MKKLTTTNGSAEHVHRVRPINDVRYWCRKLRCTENELRDTIRAVMHVLAGAPAQPATRRITID